jgi:hypothetical protein
LRWIASLDTTGILRQKAGRMFPRFAARAASSLLR